MSFSMMNNMLGTEYEKVEINVRRIENWWFRDTTSTTEVMIATMKVIVYNERVFLLLYSVHSFTCSLQE